MPQIKANGIQLEYAQQGPHDGRPLLLVNGYTAQMISWPAPLLDGLAANGFRVITYDNRDVGLSQKFPEGGTPDIRQVAGATRGKNPMPELPYTLSDMAADGIGLLDALGIERAHVMGMSMGGMLVQLMAIEHPERVISMTSVMSTTGNPDLPPATPEAQAALLEPPASEQREDVIASSVKGRRAFESPGYPKSDTDLRAQAAAAYDRMYYPQGSSRQYAAILADGSRVERLRQVRVPTLVIHGKGDNLVRMEGGIDTAEAVPEARLELIDGMGHDLPEALCPRYVELLTEHALAAER